MTPNEPHRTNRPDLTHQLTQVVRSIGTTTILRSTPHAALAEDRAVHRRLDRIDEALSEIALHLHATIAGKLDSLTRERDGTRLQESPGAVLGRKIDALAKVVEALAQSDRLGAVERQSEQLAGDVARLTDALPHRVADAVMRSGEVVLKAAGTLWSDVDEIRAATRATSENTDALGRQIDTLGQAIEQLAGDVKGSDARALQVPDRLSRIEALVASLDTGQRSLAETVGETARGAELRLQTDRLMAVEAALVRIGDQPQDITPWQNRIAEQLARLDSIETTLGRLVNAPDTNQSWRDEMLGRLDRLTDDMAETRRLATVPPQELDLAQTGFQRLTTGFRVVLRQLSDDAHALRTLIQTPPAPAADKPSSSNEIMLERLGAIEEALTALREVPAAPPPLDPVLERLAAIESAVDAMRTERQSAPVESGPGYAGALAAAPALDLARTHVQQLLAAFRVMLRQIGDDARTFSQVVHGLPAGRSAPTPAVPDDAIRADIAALRDQLDSVLQAVRAPGVDASVVAALHALDSRLDRWEDRNHSVSEQRPTLSELPLFEPERGQMQRLVVGFAQLVQRANTEVERLKDLALPAPPQQALAGPDALEPLSRAIAALKSEIAPQLAEVSTRLADGHAVLADLHALTAQGIAGSGAGLPIAGVDRLRKELDSVAATVGTRLADLTTQIERLGARTADVSGPDELAEHADRIDLAGREIAAKVDAFVSVAAAISEQLDAVADGAHGVHP